MELTLNMHQALAAEGGPGLSNRLYGELRKAILEGRLRSGEKLPATRDLAASLALSRNTVSVAYERLAREGYFEGRHGSGTFVTGHGPQVDREPSRVSAATPHTSAWARRLSPSRSIVPGRECAYDFRPGLPDLGSFPIDIWRRLTAQNLRALSSDVGGYGDAAGQPRLRSAVARYLSHSRAVLCEGRDVFICNGSQQALDLLGRILIEPGTKVAIEDPGYPPAVSVFRTMGANVIGVPVDTEGLIVEKLPQGAKVVYVTPSHQFPLGVTLSLARRKALLAWAQKTGAIIVEDDYDSEFRFGGRPLESLQGLDRSGSVVYLGTFSKVLFPGLRLGYVVAPRWLQEPLIAAKWITDRHTAALEQAVMAEFITAGHFERHLRRMQRTYGERRLALVAALARRTSKQLAIFPSHAGLHVAGLLPKDFDVATLVERAGEAGVGLYSLVPFYVGAARPGLIFGYGGCSVEDILEGTRRLGTLLEAMNRERRKPATPSVKRRRTSP
jgi:GntR family transcriptional regulator/MocR family aminotransferase